VGESAAYITRPSGLNARAFATLIPGITGVKVSPSMRKKAPPLASRFAGVK
jgi:hypothetical protein